MADRRPGAVPDEEEPAGTATAGFDTDGDGVGDTTVGTDGIDLVLLTDLDGDGLADQLLRIGPDGVPRMGPPPEPGDPVLHGLLDGIDVGF